MEHKYRIGAVKSESGHRMENTTEEVRITTNTLTKERTARMGSHDARLSIEEKKRKRYVEEKVMPGDQPAEERQARYSHISLRNRTAGEREQDAALVSHHNTFRSQSTKGFSRECEIPIGLASQELKAKRGEIRQDNAQLLSSANATAKLQSKLENALIAMRAAQDRCQYFEASEKLMVQNFNEELEVVKMEAQRALWDESMRAEIHLANEWELRRSLDDWMRRDQDSLEMVRSLQADKRNLVAELGKQKQKAEAQIKSLTGEKASLRNELDAARIAIEAGKSEYDSKLAIVLLEKDDVTKKLVLVEGKRDARSVALVQQEAQAQAQVIKLDAELAITLTLRENLERKLEDIELERDDARLEVDRQKALVIQEQNDKLRVQKTLIDKNRKLSSDVFLVRSEAAEDKRKLVEAHEKELDQAKTDAIHFMDLECLREEKNRREQLISDADPVGMGADDDARQIGQAHSNKVSLQNSLREESNRLEKLDNDVSLRQKEAAEYEEALKRARTDIFQLNKSFEEEKNRVQKLESDTNLIREEAAEDKRKLVQAHENELDEARTGVVHLKTELEYSREEKKRLENDLKVAAEEKINMLQAHKHELDEARTDIVHLETELESSKEEKKRLENDLSFIQQVAVEAKRNVLQAHEQELDEARGDIVHLKMELESSMEKKERLENDLSFIQQVAVEEKRRMLQAHKNELDEARTDVVHLKTELDCLMEEKKRLEDDLSFIQQVAVEEKRQMLQAHKIELDEAGTDMVHLKTELESSSEEKKRLENDLSFIQQVAVEEKRQMLQTHKIELAEARTNRLHLQKELQSLRKEKKRLENDLTFTQYKAADEKFKMLQRHKVELEEARTDTADLRKELEFSWEERNQLEKLQYEAAEHERKTVTEMHEPRADTGGLEKEIRYLRAEKKRLEKLECNISCIQEEAAEGKRRLEQERKELDEARTDIVRLQLELESLREAKRLLVNAQETISRNLEEEKERSLCQICLESPKDTISFPCLHLQYCFSCLEKHRKRSNTCPSCRTTINGVTCLSVLS